MPLRRSLHDPALLVRCQFALKTTQEKLGELVGCSRRTMVRWEAGHGGPSIAGWVTIARRLHATDPALASQVAMELGETLESLGIALPAAPAPPATPARPVPSDVELADAVVCAAAEAVAMAPQAIRPALLAALDRSTSLGLTVDELRQALRPAVPKPPSAKKGQSSARRVARRALRT